MDDEIISEADEWEEVPGPFIGTRQTAIVCSTCGAVSKFKYHTPRSGFSFDCPKCRKRVAMRAIQKRYYRRTKERRAVRLTDATNALLRRINHLIDTNAMRLALSRERLEVHGRRQNPRTARTYQRRMQMDAYYKDIRAKMEIDVRRGDFKPFLSYFTDEAYAKFFGDERVVAPASKPTAVEPDAI